MGNPTDQRKNRDTIFLQRPIRSGRRKMYGVPNFYL